MSLCMHHIGGGIVVDGVGLDDDVFAAQLGISLDTHALFGHPLNAVAQDKSGHVRLHRGF